MLNSFATVTAEPAEGRPKSPLQTVALALPSYWYCGRSQYQLKPGNHEHHRIPSRSRHAELYESRQCDPDCVRTHAHQLGTAWLRT
ncbi:protein of unknown function [Azospirillum lipoferum 4B]|uniref:Uncharacterized protein n=1 Tax=Azospirillum lipoferum (strain 4B) TaxID=862719 RepID=G7Z857_AZOL4|nr:protein of unknown function [Azospirillum lipoferum 4B]